MIAFTTVVRFSASLKKASDLICTPKVRQTFVGAYFYEKERKKEQKILARI